MHSFESIIHCFPWLDKLLMRTIWTFNTFRITLPSRCSNYPTSSSNHLTSPRCHRSSGITQSLRSQLTDVSWSATLRLGTSMMGKTSGRLFIPVESRHGFTKATKITWNWTVEGSQPFPALIFLQGPLIGLLLDEATFLWKKTSLDPQIMSLYSRN